MPTEEQILDVINLTEAAKKLTAKQRATLAMRAAGYTREECGVVFGMTKPAVRFIELRARTRMKEIINDDSTPHLPIVR